MAQLFTNNASSILPNDTNPGDTTITVPPGEGDRFPLPDAGNDESFAMLTLEDTSGNQEIVMMTARVGDTLTVVRGQESTAPLGFTASESRVESRLTAGSLENFKQVSEQHELRGDKIDSDGIRIWHEQNPGFYQYYTMRYYNFDVLGNLPTLHFEPPTGLPGLGINFTITASNGDLRGASLREDDEGLTPAPGTGQPYWSVPGTLRINSINTEEREDNVYIMWDQFASVAGAQYRMRFSAAGEYAVRYSFNCRDDQGNENWVGLIENGSISMMRGYEIRNPAFSKYATAQNVQVHLNEDPFSPGSRDWHVTLSTTDSDEYERSLWYSWVCVEEDDSTNPSTFKAATVSMMDGEVVVDKAPSAGNRLANKDYVDSVAGGYGRKVLYNDSSGTADGVTTELPNGAKFSDYNLLEIIGETTAAGQINIRNVLQITHETMAEYGTGTKFNVINHITGGGAAGMSIMFASDTQFTATAHGLPADTEGFVITKIVGISSKAAVVSEVDQESQVQPESIPGPLVAFHE